MLYVPGKVLFDLVFKLNSPMLDIHHCMLPLIDSVTSEISEKIRKRFCNFHHLCLCRILLKINTKFILSILHQGNSQQKQLVPGSSLITEYRLNIIREVKSTHLENFQGQSSRVSLLEIQPDNVVMTCFCLFDEDEETWM